MIYGDVVANDLARPARRTRARLRR
jgi:hypothetical protein